MAVKSSLVFFFSSTPKITPYSPRCSKLKPPRGKITTFSCSDLRYEDDDDDKRKAVIKRSHGESFAVYAVEGVSLKEQRQPQRLWLRSLVAPPMLPIYTLMNIGYTSNFFFQKQIKKRKKREREILLDVDK